MGFDDPATNAEWAAEEGFTFELWSDDSRALALYYGAATDAHQVFPSRVTVILDADGDLVLRYDEVSVSSHPGDVLEDCTLLFGP